MLVAVFVVAQDFVLQCLLQRRGIQVALTARIGLAQMSGSFQRRKQPPRIARRASNQLLANGRRELQLQLPKPALVVGKCALQQLHQHRCLQQRQRQHARP